MIYNFNSAQLIHAKSAYTTRRISFSAIQSLITGFCQPLSGDLVLARVEEIGQHKRLELADGRKAKLFPGDEVILCYGHRYAPDQFEAEVPPDLRSCHLVAAGGLAGQVIKQNLTIDPPTTLTPLGLLGDSDGKPLNIKKWGLNVESSARKRPLTIAVIGSSMNSGKTTTAAYLIRGLVKAGLTVGAAKVTGTGAGNDPWFMKDAGASIVVDFTDVGFASTYKLPVEDLHLIFKQLVGHIIDTTVDAIVVEVADGIYQDETSYLIESCEFIKSIDGVIFAACDAVGAVGGVTCLKQHGLPIIGIGGLLTTSPLAIDETRKSVHLPVWDLDDLSHPSILSLIKSSNPIRSSEQIQQYHQPILPQCCQTISKIYNSKAVNGKNS